MLASARRGGTLCGLEAVPLPCPPLSASLPPIESLYAAVHVLGAATKPSQVLHVAKGIRRGWSSVASCEAVWTFHCPRMAPESARGRSGAVELAPAQAAAATQERLWTGEGVPSSEAMPPEHLRGPGIREAMATMEHRRCRRALPEAR